MNNNLIFFVTTPSNEEAQKIAHHLVEHKLAACVNIISPITSIYWWNDTIEEDNEVFLLIKTTQSKAQQLIQTIEEIHTYDTPECIGIPIEKGSKKYLEWLNSVLK
ncbi:MAG: Divalent-cation tolerance protein CutA [Promethearchaeota archaeon]|nr:MAG: Divalent-cation tolerance protein CutA [Candidatus Lokiarchaeota archaeon]